MDIEKLKFPIGEFTPPAAITREHIETWINDLEAFPKSLRSATKDLDIEALNWPYRPEGWTIKQVVHHCADSHLNSIMRFKLALTEDVPTIRPYDQDRWSLLPDAQNDDISSSLSILDGLHDRLVQLLRSLDDRQLERTFFHPEHQEEFSVKVNIGVYAWHSNHHLAHVRQAIDSEGACLDLKTQS